MRSITGLFTSVGTQRPLAGICKMWHTLFFDARNSAGLLNFPPRSLGRAFKIHRTLFVHRTVSSCSAPSQEERLAGNHQSRPGQCDLSLSLPFARRASNHGLCCEFQICLCQLRKKKSHPPSSRLEGCLLTCFVLPVDPRPQSPGCSSF